MVGRFRANLVEHVIFFFLSNRFWLIQNFDRQSRIVSLVVLLPFLTG